MRCVVLALVLAASPAAAHDPPTLQKVQSSTPNHVDCWCRAQGRLFAVGESICLRTAEGGRMAECGMALNVTSWGITEKPCPES